MKTFGKNYFYLLSVICLLLFTAVFSNFLKFNIKPIFAKDLYAYDESANSVAGANVYRKFFPSQLRLNPLIDDYKLNDWIEAKYWMHVPPLFAYVPYPLYKIDGQVTIEMKRLSYALVTFLTGIFFMAIAKIFFREFKYVFASFVASLLWLFAPYTRDLIMGFNFGLSDIVLAFATVVAFAGVAYYFVYLRDRIKIQFWPYFLIGVFCALPFCAKSMLGLIPFATMIFAMLFSTNRIKKLALLVSGFLIIAGLFYIPLYNASPRIFLYEFMTSFKHFDNYEGWQRPWNMFFSDYLPHNYLLNICNMELFFGLYIVGSAGLFLIKDKAKRNLLIVAGVWFIWNLAVVSFVKSKAPNFVYSTYLFGLFFVITNIFIILEFAFKGLGNIFQKLDERFINIFLILLTLGAIYYAGSRAYGATVAFAAERANNIQLSDRAKFYDLAVYGRDLGWNSDDLVIIDAPDAYWLRFYVMFISGSEGVDLGQMNELIANGSASDIVASKYRSVHFVKVTGVCSSDPFYIESDSTVNFNGYTIYNFNTDELQYLGPVEYHLCD